MYQFEKLNVWGESVRLIEMVYSLVRELSLSERGGLTQSDKVGKMLNGLIHSLSKD